jgi:hypothetical protein
MQAADADSSERGAHLACKQRMRSTASAAPLPRAISGCGVQRARRPSCVQAADAQCSERGAHLACKQRMRSAASAAPILRASSGCAVQRARRPARVQAADAQYSKRGAPPTCNQRMRSAASAAPFSRASSGCGVQQARRPSHVQSADAESSEGDAPLARKQRRLCVHGERPTMPRPLLRQRSTAHSQHGCASRVAGWQAGERSPAMRRSEPRSAPLVSGLAVHRCRRARAHREVAPHACAACVRCHTDSAHMQPHAPWWAAVAHVPTTHAHTGAASGHSERRQADH